MSDAARALVYLQATSLAGNVRQRLRRMRQPRYLLGAVVGAVYLYVFLFRRMMAAPDHGVELTRFPPAFVDAFALIVAVGLLLAMAYAWVMPSDRAALRFSEAETDFLFPAPISRTGLIHFSLLRSQLAIFASSFLLVLLFRRNAVAGVHPLQYATALWLVMATLRLHYLGASFTRERLAGLGVRPAVATAAVIGLLAVVALACILWARRLGPPPLAAGTVALAGYVTATLGSGPAAVVLAPLRWLAAPLFTHGAGGFLRALAPAVALFLLHYVWVVRAQVSFEEASIVAARRRAETRAAMREGRLRFGPRIARARAPAFELRPTGFAPVAFLWSGLTAAGPFWRRRTAVLAVLLVVGITRALATMTPYRMALDVVALVSLAGAGWVTLLGPMIAQRRLQELPRELDVLRALPLPGWQLALGQLLTPAAMLLSVQWLLLVIAASAGYGGAAPGWLSPGTVGAMVVTALLLLPLADLLLMCVPFSLVLLFPAWTAGAARGGGVDVMGQRLLFVGAYLLVLAVALVPAALAAAIVFIPMRLIAPLPAAIVGAVIAATAVFAAVVSAWLGWLGRRVEGFDVATELA